MGNPWTGGHRDQPEEGNRRLCSHRPSRRCRRLGNDFGNASQIPAKHPKRPSPNKDPPVNSRPSNAGISPSDSERSSPKMRLQPPTRCSHHGVREELGGSREWEKGEGGWNFPHLFLPMVSWSLTTTVSSASGSSGTPFRSHSNPWEKRGGTGRDQHLEVEIPNPKPLQNHSIPKARFPSKSTWKTCLGKKFSSATDYWEGANLRS